MKPVRFLRPAEDEASEAIDYFDAQRPGLGARFEQDLRETLAFIADHPLSGKLVRQQVRTFPCSRFPYAIVYVVDDAEVVIVAVAHHRRRPAYWRGRVP